MDKTIHIFDAIIRGRFLHIFLWDAARLVMMSVAAGATQNKTSHSLARARLLNHWVRTTVRTT